MVKHARRGLRLAEGLPEYVPVTGRLTAETVARLEVLAAQRGLKRSALIRQILENAAV